MTTEIKTICVGGVPVLEIIEEPDTITILEADDMDQRIQFPAATIPAIINHLKNYLENLK